VSEFDFSSKERGVKRRKGKERKKANHPFG